MHLIDSIALKSGREIELYKISGAGKNILIIGVFHGEEPQGFWAVENYFFKNLPQNSKNNIYIIPCLNPDGMAKNTRKNSNGVDLNRNFSTKNWAETDYKNDYFGGKTPASEEETKFCINTIKRIKPDLILTLHSPFAIVNYDGNAKEIAEKISQLTNYPVQADIGYPTPGSFGTYCGVERGIPTITLEFDENEKKSIISEKGKKVFDFLLKEF